MADTHVGKIRKRGSGTTVNGLFGGFRHFLGVFAFGRSRRKLLQPQLFESNASLA